MGVPGVWTIAHFSYIHIYIYTYMYTLYLLGTILDFESKADSIICRREATLSTRSKGLGFTA